jgi:GT2 family glycosyltransferase
MRMHNVHYYCLSTDNQYFSMFSLLEVSKLYFHIQFNSHNIQVLNNKCMISTFSHRPPICISFYLFISYYYYFYSFILFYFLGFWRPAKTADILIVSR